MSERYHSGGPRQEATGGIFVLDRKVLGVLGDAFVSAGWSSSTRVSCGALLTWVPWGTWQGKPRKWTATPQVITPQCEVPN